MSVGHIPDEHLAIQRVPCRDQQAIIVGESQVANLMIVLRQSIDSLLLAVVPDYDIRVFAALPRRQQVTIVGDGEAHD